MFSMVFMESVGKTSGSFLAGEQSFQAREKEFRREMDALRTSAHRDIVTEVRLMLQPSFLTQLNHRSDIRSLIPRPLSSLTLLGEGGTGEEANIWRSQLSEVGCLCVL